MLFRMRKLAQWLNGEAPYILKGVVYKMKKNLTKLLALMMALALVFSLAACGGDDTTGDSSEANAGASNNAEETLDPADPDATVPSGEESTVEGQSGETQNDATTPNGDKVTTPNGQTPTQNSGNTNTGLNSTDKAAVIKAYQDAAKNSPKVKRVQTLALTQVNLGKDDGNSKMLQNIANGIINKNNNIESDGLPGNYGALTANDLQSASAKTTNGVTTLTMVLKDQLDYAQGYPGSAKKDAWGAGPVGHGIGVLGPVDDILKEFTGKIKDNKDIQVKYTGAQMTVTVKDGKITGGKMGYTVKITATDVTVLYVIPLSATGTIRYDYTIKG